MIFKCSNNVSSTVLFQSHYTCILQAEAKSELLFDTEHQGSGLYQPELDDPEHCNAHNSALYETHLLAVSTQNYNKDLPEFCLLYWNKALTYSG